MEPKNLLDARNRLELRAWLKEHHATEPECWVVVRRGRPVDDGTFWYVDAVEEALCFGWIDSTTKRLESGVTAQRLCPRRLGSAWSELNKERVRRLERLGLMTEAGRAVLPPMGPRSFRIDPDIVRALKAARCYSTFKRFPPLYQRVRADTVQIKKGDPDLFSSRLEKLVSNTRRGVMYGEWSDNGRLIEDDGAWTL